MSSNHNLMLVGDESWPLIILAHGAGAAMDSPFMEQVTELLLQHEVAVARFEFPYMAQRRVTGKKRPPDGQKKLLDCWRTVYQSLQHRQPVIGGKSMGGRMASMLCDELQPRGLVCLGYPFHPPGKPEKTRTEHLQEFATPALMVQGSRDPMGSREDVANYALSESLTFLWLEDGNHDLKPRVKSGFTQEQHLQQAADAVAQFVKT